MKTWLDKWEPENESFWNSIGKKIAKRTLVITTLSLILSFASWFLMSSVATKLTGVGFRFTEKQLYWLVAIPGLAAGAFRVVHSFLIPIYGTRHTLTVATFSKIIPLAALALAVTNLDTPFWVFVIIALLLGAGGGDFSSFMPSTNLFFPNKEKGAALGIQAGIGNYGVSIVQFLTPVLIGMAIIGAPQVMEYVDASTQEVLHKEIYLQNAILVYAPFAILMGLACWFGLRSVPVRASFKEQLDIFSDKHTWFCTITYILTFGTFAGLSAAFPMMIKSLYGGFENAPDPLRYAFYGPLISSTARILSGFVADKIGGAVLTTIAGVGIISGCAALVFFDLTAPASMEQFPYFIAVILMIFFFTGVGNASTFKQFPMVFRDNQRKASGVIGWTSAVAAFGSFVVPFFIGQALFASFESQGVRSANGFFIGYVVFCIGATLINWYYYQRKGCERPS